jgi:hypothetical protein
MPTFILEADGREYTTEVPSEIVRLRASRKYTEKGVELPPTIKDEQFHPEGKLVGEVLAHLQEHPEDTARVIAEEKAGQNRPTIVAD